MNPSEYDKHAKEVQQMADADRANKQPPALDKRTPTHALDRGR